MERKGILQFMRNCLSDPNYNKIISSNKRLIKLIKNLFSHFYIHYGLKDIEENGRCKHQLRFTLLYLEKNKMTFTEIADETLLNVTEDTFKHHVKKYNQTILKFITAESYVDANYAILLEEYFKQL